ncbi:MAG: hypothetical protein RQ750_12230, partial [Roseovarius sp.]|nr:hypothetical protein [Roseovarius sp.]
PATSGAVVVLGQVTVPVVDASNDEASIQILRGGAVVDAARGEFLRVITIARSFVTMQGVSETFTVRGFSGTVSPQVAGDFANIVILERFR